MRKISLFTVVVTAALLTYFVGGWATSASQARDETSASVQSIDPLRMMMNAPRNMATEEVTDYTFVFE